MQASDDPLPGYTQLGGPVAQTAVMLEVSQGHNREVPMLIF
jgi:hypothetical protein